VLQVAQAFIKVRSLQYRERVVDQNVIGIDLNIVLDLIVDFADLRWIVITEW